MENIKTINAFNAIRYTKEEWEKAFTFDHGTRKHYLHGVEVSYILNNPKAGDDVLVFRHVFGNDVLCGKIVKVTSRTIQVRHGLGTEVFYKNFFGRYSDKYRDGDVYIRVKQGDNNG